MDSKRREPWQAICMEFSRKSNQTLSQKNKKKTQMVEVLDRAMWRMNVHLKNGSWTVTFTREVWRQAQNIQIRCLKLWRNHWYSIIFPLMWQAAEDLITLRCNPDWTWSDDYINNWEEVSDSEIWKAIKEERRLKKISNAEWSLNFLKEKWIEFTILSQSSFHVRVQHFDFYPTTWLFINMKTKKQWRWVKNLFNILPK